MRLAMRPWLPRQLARLLGEERGSLVVEFVIVLPLILGMLVLISEFGRAFWYYQIVTKGVRDGVRYLSRAPAAEFNVFAERARYLAMTGQPDVSAAPAYAWWTDIGTVTTSAPETVGGPPQFRTSFERITMRAAVPVSFPLLALVGQDPTITIVAADQARYVGD
jgi:Flp pilus assembly protein TadG